jgi:hypothetical protein
MSHRTGRSLDPAPRWITGKILFFFQFRSQILTHKSKFHVIGFSYGSNTDMPWGGSPIARQASMWPPPPLAGHKLPEFQHSSLTFRPRIVATAVSTSTWRASPTMGNASVDDTNAAAIFFFTTDGKTHIHAFPFLYS